MRATRVLLASALAAAIPVTGCGEEERSVDPTALLAAASANPVASAVTELDLQMEVQGIRQLSDPLSLSAEGPYISGNGQRIPSVDLEVEADVAGYGLESEVVSTGDNVYLSVFGDNYQVGREAIAVANARMPELAVDPSRWLRRPAYEGDEEVAGVDTAHINGRLRAEELTEDLAPLVAELGLVAEFGTVDVWVGFDDQIVRKLELVIGFSVAAPQRELLRGASGGRIGLELVLSEVGEGQEITIPEGGGFKPIGQLIESINDLGSGLFALGLA